VVATYVTFPFNCTVFLTNSYPASKNIRPSLVQIVYKHVASFGEGVQDPDRPVCNWSILKHLPNYLFILKPVRGKVKFSLCLTKHHGVKTYDGVLVYFHAFLTLTLDGVELSASRPGRFTLRGRARVTH
jgi:hypothetical protein